MPFAAASLSLTLPATDAFRRTRLTVGVGVGAASSPESPGAVDVPGAM